MRPIQTPARMLTTVIITLIQKRRIFDRDALRLMKISVSERVSERVRTTCNDCYPYQ